MRPEGCGDLDRKSKDRMFCWMTLLVTLPTSKFCTLVKILFVKVNIKIKTGFQWATREGPLYDELIRNVNFLLTNAELTKMKFTETQVKLFQCQEEFVTVRF